MNQSKEISKFFSGATFFHALVHAYFWISGTSLTIFGITQTSTINMTATVVSVILAVALGLYAWRSPYSKGNFRTSKP